MTTRDAWQAWRVPATDPHRAPKGGPGSPKGGLLLSILKSDAKSQVYRVLFHVHYFIHISTVAIQIKPDGQLFANEKLRFREIK